MLKKGHFAERKIKKELISYFGISEKDFFCIRCAKESFFDLILKLKNKIFLIEVKNTKHNTFYFSKKKELLIQLNSLFSFCLPLSNVIPCVFIHHVGKIYPFRLTEEVLNNKKLSLKEEKVSLERFFKNEAY